MENETQEQRAKRLKKERSQQELEYELSRDLKRKKDVREMKEIKNQYRNKYADMTILFFLTLATSYLLLFVLRWMFLYFFGPRLGWFGISIAFINPLLHATAWVVAILSVYRGRSVLDDIFHWFF
jgi:uncharacterized membrane protein